MIHATPQDAAQCQDLAQQCIANERHATVNKRADSRYYNAQKPPQKRGRPPGKASAKRRTPQARKVRERGSGHVQDPWNRDGEMRLFLCDSVRAILPMWSEHK